MSYHRFNKLAKLINRDLEPEIGRGIISKDLMDRKCNCSFPYKFNGKWVYKGKCWSKCLIYKVKCSMCDAIYIGKTHKTLKKRIDGLLSSLLYLLKKWWKSGSFTAHFEQLFNDTTSRTDIRKYMMFKVVKQPHTIRAMKTFTKPNCNICMEERLSILKNLRDKHVTFMNKNLDIYGACRKKTALHQLLLSTDDPIFNRWKG